MNTIYFDNAATTKIKSEVFNEMLPYLSTNYGNASSLSLSAIVTNIVP